jgi:hypothetical protein
MEYHCRLSMRVPDTLPSDPVTVTSLKDSGVEGLDDRIPHWVIMAEAGQRRSSESPGRDYGTSA